MKKISKLFLLLVVAFTAVSFTSCLSDDDEPVYVKLTATQKQNAVTDAQGVYTGKYYYFKNNPSSIYKVSQDSIASYFSLQPTLKEGEDSISSATVTSSFPVKILASYAGDDSTIVKTFPDVKLSGNAAVYDQQYKSYVEQNAYMYYLNFGTELNGSDGGGNTVTVKLINETNLVFLNSSYTPIMMTYNKQASGYILVESITVNGTKHDVNIPITIVGKKSI